MNAPFGIIFLRKAELYNLVKRFDEQSAIDKKKPTKAPNTWTVEKNIFKWSYKGHKHLGTPLTPDFFKRGNKKLSDWYLADEEGKIKKEYEIILKFPEKILENMVIKGFADFYDNLEHSKGIILNKEGLLLGEVIYNVGGRKPPVIYQIYSWLMDYGGAWILLILVILTIIMTWTINLINIFCR